MSYCGWFSPNELQREYHEEWGTPLHDDKMQFEYLSMEVMQCGLNFGLVLRKRGILRQCFDDFDFDKVADYGEADVARIMNTDGMIKAERKIRAIISNAKAFQKVRETRGTFSDYLWSYTDHKTVLYKGHETGLIPASNALSERISRDFFSANILCPSGVNWTPSKERGISHPAVGMDSIPYFLASFS